MACKHGYHAYHAYLLAYVVKCNILQSEHNAIMANF